MNKAELDIRLSKEEQRTGSQGIDARDLLDEMKKILSETKQSN